MSRNHTLINKMLVRILLLGLFLQSCGEGLSNQLISKEKKQVTEVPAVSKQNIKPSGQVNQPLSKELIVTLKESIVGCDEERNELKVRSGEGKSIEPIRDKQKAANLGHGEGQYCGSLDNTSSLSQPSIENMKKFLKQLI